MTDRQRAFLSFFAGLVMFAVGSILVPMHNAGQISEGLGMFGGICWLVGIPLGLLGIIWSIVLVSNPRDST